MNIKSSNINYYQRMRNSQKWLLNNKKSIPFISQTQKGLQINQEALQFMSGLPPKQCQIIGIVGRAKTGKSTLMNHLINQFASQSILQQYFEVSSSLGGGTKGINILTNYVELDDNNILLFLDMEGLGRFNNSQAYQSKLFVVALLLSTTFIYNTVGAIDEQALLSLSIFIQIGKILEKSIIKPSYKEQTIQLPSLFVALRDFSLQLENKQGFAVSAKQYLDSALEQQRGSSQTILHKNRIRRTIKEMFKKRNCQTIVLPSDDLPITFNSSLRPQFSRDLKRFFGKMQNHLQQQKESRKLFEPSQLVIYAQQILEAVKVNAHQPVFNNILQNVCQKQIQAIKEKYKQIIQKLMKQFDNQAIRAEYALQSITDIGSFEDNHAQTYIVRLQNFNKMLEEIYSKKNQQIYCLIQKQKIKGYKYNGQEEIKSLQSIRRTKAEQISKRIQDLKQIGLAKQKQLTIKHLQEKQAQQFNIIIEQLCLIQNYKELEKKYNHYIYELRDRCQPINSKQFQTGLLKCEVAFLRRKIQLKQRQPRQFFSNLQKHHLPPKSKQRKALKEWTNNPEQFCLPSKLKVQDANEQEVQCQKGGLSKAFYIPYVVLSDPTIMNVEIIKTLIKQDHRLNNYIEYVLQVVIMERRWVFNRKWKDFNQLHSILTNLFQTIDLPPFTYAQIALKVDPEVQKEEVEERRQKLQTYIRQLLQIEPIRNSRIMQKFLKINKEYVPTL